MYRGGGVFLAVGLGLDTNIRIFLTIFRRFSDIVRGGRKIASSIGKMFQMCMFACFIWNNVPVNCIIQNHYFEIGYEMFVNTRMCLVCFSSKAELVN